MTKEWGIRWDDMDRFESVPCPVCEPHLDDARPRAWGDHGDLEAAVEHVGRAIPNSGDVRPWNAASAGKRLTAYGCSNFGDRPRMNLKTPTGQHERGLTNLTVNRQVNLATYQGCWRIEVDRPYCMP
jgi:hypothetical protein